MNNLKYIIYRQIDLYFYFNIYYHLLYNFRINLYHYN